MATRNEVWIREEKWSRIVFGIPAAIFAGVVLLFGWWSWRNFQECAAVSDFAHWVQSPGTLTSLEILPQSSFWGSRHHITCTYRYDHAGQAFTGNQFTLEFPRRKLTLETAKLHAESVLGIAEKAQWRRLTGESESGWAMISDGLAIHVRHSPLRPQFAALDSAAPMPAFLYWALIIFQILVALAATMALFFCLMLMGHSSDPLKDSAWRANLFSTHGQATIRRWAVSLQYFRLIRSWNGGMLDQGDCLMVVLLATTLQDLKQICSALGVAKATQPNHSTQPESTTELTDSLLQQILSSGAAMIAGVRVSISYHSMRLIVSLTDEKLPGDVTEATVAAALTVEQRLASQAKHIIDPPDDSKHCVCPRYYPSFWEENPAQH